jgi:hypothetical protein
LWIRVARIEVAFVLWTDFALALAIPEGLYASSSARRKPRDFKAFVGRPTVDPRYKLSNSLKMNTALVLDGINDDTLQEA